MEAQGGKEHRGEEDEENCFREASPSVASATSPQPAFCAARMCAIAAPDSLRFLRVLIGTTFPCAFAARAPLAAAIRARPAAGIVLTVPGPTHPPSAMEVRR